MNKNIEVEVRAEISLSQFDDLLLKLKERHKEKSHVKRLTVMFFGEINQVEFDIRVRVTDKGDAEVVVKKGDYHSHNRSEASQRIEKDQFLGMVHFFSIFGFGSKVTERENFNFELEDNMELSLVRAKSIAYVEVEKMSDKESADRVRGDLVEVLEEFDLEPINSDGFMDLCSRLGKETDIIFTGSEDDFRALKERLLFYGVLSK